MTTFHFPSDLSHVKEAGKKILHTLTDLHLDESAFFDIKLCVEEALINAMKHGNGLDSRLTVDVQVIRKADSVEIIICDHGKGFNYLQCADPTREENLTKTEGRGIFLIKRLMDDVIYEQNGSCLHMIKKIRHFIREEKMRITQIENNGFTVVTLEGEIDLDSSPQMRKVFQELIEKEKLKIIINFEKVIYIDSSGLATLIEMMQRLKKNHGQMFLVQMSEKIKSIFEITKLDKLFIIYPTQEQALTVV